MQNNNIKTPVKSQVSWAVAQAMALDGKYKLVPHQRPKTGEASKPHYWSEDNRPQDWYPINSKYWTHNPDVLAIRLDGMLLLDIDGNKRIETILKGIADAKGVRPEDLTEADFSEEDRWNAVADILDDLCATLNINLSLLWPHLIQWDGPLTEWTPREQWREAGTSLHCLFSVPEGVELSSSCKPVPYVDIKATKGAIVNLKSRKRNRFNGFKLVQAPGVFIKLLKVEKSSNVVAIDSYRRDDKTLEEAIDVLSYIPSDCSEPDWKKIIDGFKAEFGHIPNAFEVAHSWSAKGGTKYKSREDVLKYYERSNPGGGVTWGSVVWEAMKYGYGPRRQTAQEAFKDYRLTDTPLVVAHPDLMEASEIPLVSGIAGENDHALDADIILSRVFANRLAVAGGSFRWWNGRCWDVVGENDIRRHVSEAMVGTVSRAKVTNSRVAGTIQLMKDRAERLAPLDPRNRLVFFKNCVLNVATGKTESHAKENGNTFTLSVDYDPLSVCPEFLNWLGDIFDTDMDRVLLLQEFIGWGLISDNLGIQKAPLLIGAPRSGKGTVLSLLREILGETATGAFLFKDMDSNKGLASMANKQIAIDSDAGSPNRNNASAVCSIFKAVTANEPVSVQLLWEQQVMQKSLNCKLYVGSNKIPNVYDDSAALANRWLPLKFNKSFLGREDTTLLDRLSNEKAGITIWALEGLQRLMTTGRFTMPETSKDMLDSIVEASAPLERFIDEMMVLGSEEKGTESDMWEAYQSWVFKSGGERMGRPQFMKAMEEVGYMKGFSRKKSVRFGVQVIRGFVGVRPINRLPPPTTMQ